MGTAVAAHRTGCRHSRMQTAGETRRARQSSCMRKRQTWGEVQPEGLTRQNQQRSCWTGICVRRFALEGDGVRRAALVTRPFAREPPPSFGLYQAERLRKRGSEDGGRLLRASELVMAGSADRARAVRAALERSIPSCRWRFRLRSRLVCRHPGHRAMMLAVTAAAYRHGARRPLPKRQQRRPEGHPDRRQQQEGQQPAHVRRLNHLAAAAATAARKRRVPEGLRRARASRRAAM